MTAVPVRQAATLAVIRDGRAGVEVCILRRNARSAFVGGAYLFPGGAVDPDDRPADAWCIGAEQATANDRRLAASFDSAGHRIAAIRETLEESGLLVAASTGSSPPDLLDPAIAAKVGQAREGGAPALARLLRAHGWQLQLDALRYVAHWVTPAGAPRRYDTRFFLAAAPEHCPPLAHDGTEAVAASWERPAALLARHATGDAPMLPPTTALLQWLSDCGADVSSLLAAAAAIGEVPRIEPRVVTDHRGRRRIVTDSDPAYHEGRQDGEPLPDWRPPA